LFAMQLLSKEETAEVAAYLAQSSDARKELAENKVAAANMAWQVVDIAIQANGGGGGTGDFGVAAVDKRARTLRIVDGPDEVHRDQLARLELRQYRPPRNEVGS